MIKDVNYHSRKATTERYGIDAHSFTVYMHMSISYITHVSTNTKVHDGRSKIAHFIQCDNATFTPWPLGSLVGRLVHISGADIRVGLRSVPQRHGQHWAERPALGKALH